MLIMSCVRIRVCFSQMLVGEEHYEPPDPIKSRKDVGGACHDLLWYVDT